MLNRRHLFGVTGAAVVLTAVPVAVHASPLPSIQSEGELFAMGVALIHADLGPLARQAVADGWKPDELFAITNSGNGMPALLFRREGELVADPQVEGWSSRTDLSGTYQHGIPTATKEHRWMVDPEGRTRTDNRHGGLH